MSTKRTAFLVCATVFLAVLCLNAFRFRSGFDRVRFILDWAFQGQQAVFTIPVDDGTLQES